MCVHALHNSIHAGLRVPQAQIVIKKASKIVAHFMNSPKAYLFYAKHMKK